MPTGDLGQLYDDHAASLFAFLLNLTRDLADTRDILQEVFRRLATRPGLLDGVRDERAFLLCLAHHVAIDLVRRQDARRRAHARFAEEPGEPVDLFARNSDPDCATVQSTIALALGELPEEQRLVVQLKIWEGLTFDRIGQVLGIPLNTAASRYRYAMDKLRLRLRPLYDEMQPLGGTTDGP